MPSYDTALSHFFHIHTQIVWCRFNLGLFLGYRNIFGLSWHEIKYIDLIPIIRESWYCYPHLTLEDVPRSSRSIFKWRRLVEYVFKTIDCQRNFDLPLLPFMSTDNKVNGANMGPTWVMSAPDELHVGPMNLAIRGCLHWWLQCQVEGHLSARWWSWMKFKSHL